MAKHIKNNSDVSPSASNNAAPYVYPDGRVYGSPYVSAEERKVQQAAQPYGRDAYTEGAKASDIQQNRELQKKKRRKRFAIAGGVLAAILLLVGCGALFFVQQMNHALYYDSSSDTERILTKLSEEEPKNIAYTLLIGSDQRSSSENKESSRSDVLLLVRTDTVAKTVTLVSIPRDTPWQQESGGYYKINEAYYMGGASGAIEAVEQVTGVSINHVVEVHMDTLAEFIDSIGGLYYDVPVEINYYDYTNDIEYHIDPGEQTLNGQDAVMLMRARKDYGSDGDANRQSTIRGVVKALYEQALSRPVTEIPGMVINAAHCVDTDMGTRSITQLFMALGTSPSFYTASGPTDGGIDEGSNGEWLCYLNPTGWERLMKMVIDGEDPSGIDYSEDVVYWPSTGEPVYE